MKKYFMAAFACTALLLSLSCTKADYKKITDDFIKNTSQIKDYAVREVSDTNSAEWKAVIVYVKQQTANVPVIFFVSRDGKSVVPNSMVFSDNKPIFTKHFEPELGRINFRPADKDCISPHTCPSVPQDGYPAAI